ncbi:MAG: hypothetical protein NTX03_08895 [Bacteroidetes bacterium]|nr:hypothetical protein [Bacteroidota bacterium]
MKKILFTLALIATTAATSFSQDFRIVESNQGYYNPLKAEKIIKVNPLQKKQVLTTWDFNKDGKMDTIFYRKSTSGGDIATVVVFDVKEDEWITLYKMDLKGYGGFDGIWFYQLADKTGGTPHFVIYTGRTDKKFCTVIRYDAAIGKFKYHDYPLFEKNVFPHRYVDNKNKILNQNSISSQEEFESIKVE